MRYFSEQRAYLCAPSQVFCIQQNSCFTYAKNLLYFRTASFFIYIFCVLLHIALLGSWLSVALVMSYRTSSTEFKVSLWGLWQRGRTLKQTAESKHRITNITRIMATLIMNYWTASWLKSVKCLPGLQKAAVDTSENPFGVASVGFTF